MSPLREAVLLQMRLRGFAAKTVDFLVLICVRGDVCLGALWGAAWPRQPWGSSLPLRVRRRKARIRGQLTAIRRYG